MKKITFLLLITILITSCRIESEIEKHEQIGEIFSAGSKVFYMEDCNNFASCGNTERHKEINRSLVCDQLNSTVTPIYNKSYELSENITFTLKELYEIKPWGLQKAFSSKLTYAVLEDSDGKLSTRLFYGFSDGKICN